MVKLKVVYRILRTISDWILAGYYDEVLVQGKENVPKDGPVIMVSTHHNEIIDIATLAVTVPHRRHLAFWAKSSMFNSLIGGAIMSSSGAIPVKRNPNRGADTTDTTTLFVSTSRALSRGEVIGVFPEGTSYTQPSIVQIMSGTAWAAVEYFKWERERRAHTGGKDQGIPAKAEMLVIVPVAIVYTDKSQYLSRVVVQYGSPVHVVEHAREILSAECEAGTDERTAVKNIMGKVEEQLFAMTVNASDWETLFAAQTARDILWGDRKIIPSQHWTKISQTLVRLFTESSSPSLHLKSTNTKLILTRYFSLLHHTSLTHSLAEDILPLPFTIASSLSGYPTRTYHLKTLAHRFLNPISLVTLPFKLTAFGLFLPALVIHIPAYISSHLLVKVLATPGEEEGIVQYAAIGAGVGLGTGWIAGSGSWAWRCISFALGAVERFGFAENCKYWLGQSLLLRNIHRLTSLVSAYHAFSKLYPGRQILGSVVFGWIMIKWHGLFISAFHKKYKLLVATHRLGYHLAFLKPSSWIPAVGVDVERYYQLPPPPTNEFIRKREQTREKAGTRKVDTSSPPKIPAHRLIAHLLDAREKAKCAVLDYMKNLEGSDKEREDIEWLRAMGARMS